jgi:hypothetical protein
VLDASLRNKQTHKLASKEGIALGNSMRSPRTLSLSLSLREKQNGLVRKKQTGLSRDK